MKNLRSCWKSSREEPLSRLMSRESTRKRKKSLKSKLLTFSNNLSLCPNQRTFQDPSSLNPRRRIERADPRARNIIARREGRGGNKEEKCVIRRTKRGKNQILVPKVLPHPAITLLQNHSRQTKRTSKKWKNF